MKLTEEGLTKEVQLAMKSGDKLRLSVLRLLLSSVKNARVAKMGDLSEDEVLAVIQKEAKKRDEAAAEYRKAGREDRALDEEAEGAVLKQWLPQQLSDSEVATIVEETIEELEATGPPDLGKVMKAVMAKVQGRADGKFVSESVKARLNK